MIFLNGLIAFFIIEAIKYLKTDNTKFFWGYLCQKYGYIMLKSFHLPLGKQNFKNDAKI